MVTKVNFDDPIFQEYPDRLYMYFKAWQPVEKVRKLIAKGIHALIIYEGNDLDIGDRVTVCVSKDFTRGGYTYTYEYGDSACELRLSRILNDILELFEKEEHAS